MCMSCAWCMSCACLAHSSTGHSQVMRRSSAGQVQFPRRSHPGHAQVTHSSRAGLAQVTLRSHAGHVQVTCRSRAVHMQVMLRSCAGHVLVMCTYVQVMETLYVEIKVLKEMKKNISLALYLGIYCPDRYHLYSKKSFSFHVCVSICPFIHSSACASAQ